MTEARPSSATLRENFTRDYLLPLARAWFELEPRCQSVLVTVGQYWCDEAADAVHCSQLACVEAEPSWPESGQARAGAIVDDELLAEYEDGTAPGEGPPGLSEVQFPKWEEAATRAFGRPFGADGDLNENGDMIVAFASFCREVSSQEEPSWRSHVPYGLIRRPAEGAPLVLEVVGKMHRPQWEDRWDVLEQDGIITETVTTAATSVALTDVKGTATSERKSTRGVVSPQLLWFLLAIGAIVTYRVWFQK